MEGNPYAASFRELIVYQRARSLAREVFLITRAFPTDERYSMTDQVKRSSRSIGAQIAEAWGKRRYEKHFVSKLTDADAEQYETQHWIDTALDCGYVDDGTRNDLHNRLSEIGRMLNGMINKSRLFCPKHGGVIKEDAAEYFVSEPAAPD